MCRHCRAHWDVRTRSALALRRKRGERLGLVTAIGLLLVLTTVFLFVVNQ